MILLYRYILAHFLRNLGMIMASFITLYLLIDFFEKIDNFLEKGKSFSLIATFFFANIPFIIDLMSPVCILLAGVVTLGVLNHSNELIALKACGIPLKKITVPIIGAALACTLLFLAMDQYVLPKTIAVTNQIWNKEIKGKVPLGIYRNGRYYYRGQEGFYSFSRPDPQKNLFKNFSYTVWDKEHAANTLIAAEIAVWNKGVWTLRNGQIQKAAGGDRFATQVFTNRRINFPETPDDFFVPAYRSMELSLVQLYKETQHTRSEEERSKAWADFYGRISYTLLGLPLLLLGLPLLLLVYRKWGRDLSLAIPVSCGMAFLCWGVYTTLQSLAKASYIPPLAAAISVHLLVGCVGFFLLLREDV
ncbi:permease YjgP/YjgQ family protein [Desulfobulbus propionicus DSM 2032]|jgi:lipopolysaccharide export system permease protein|uniref:Permease YjgP/YjgQ family protein n=1 Tax=Desulfobulbus propionicus (strain ATCC 33891 / DSM 2032 / VKM B-1956 / 1pr3) TaxID=577650 RepID=A0A7U3YIZ2_DESPD|nr:LptF/LptG family permease [Desulfobulbus propionicus]ADW16281.1 permease YjgP/YjgQ family protein [Desulfobulbus propionicus DSM 2032]